MMDVDSASPGPVSPIFVKKLADTAKALISAPPAPVSPSSSRTPSPSLSPAAAPKRRARAQTAPALPTQPTFPNPHAHIYSPGAPVLPRSLVGEKWDPSPLSSPIPPMVPGERWDPSPLFFAPGLPPEHWDPSPLAQPRWPSLRTDPNELPGPEYWTHVTYPPPSFPPTSPQPYWRPMMSTPASPAVPNKPFDLLREEFQSQQRRIGRQPDEDGPPPILGPDHSWLNDPALAGLAADPLDLAAFLVANPFPPDQANDSTFNNTF